MYAGNLVGIREFWQQIRIACPYIEVVADVKEGVQVPQQRPTNSSALYRLHRKRIAYFPRKVSTREKVGEVLLVCLLRIDKESA